MSSKRAQRRKACTGKHRYGTELEARRAIHALRRDKPVGGQLTTYRCPFCGGYHFGHPPRRVRQALGARAEMLPP